MAVSSRLAGHDRWVCIHHRHFDARFVLFTTQALIPTSTDQSTASSGLIALNNPSYIYKAWHGTLLTIASVGMTLLFNVFLARKLPLIEGILVVIHIFGFFGVIVTLWVLSPTGDPKTVFVRAHLPPPPSRATCC